jgi:hypothetical protein
VGLWGPEESRECYEFAPVPVLSRKQVFEIAKHFESLNPYSFGGSTLKDEKVNHVDNDPDKPLRNNLFGYAISSKRYCLFSGKHVREIVEGKEHGIGYLMDPTKNGTFTEEFWLLVLAKEWFHFRKFNLIGSTVRP